MRTLHILWIEESPQEIDLIKEGFTSCEILPQLHFVNDGTQALSFLQNHEKYSHVPEPDLIFFNLNIPSPSDYEILKILKSTTHWSRIPVIVLSQSSSPQDILTTYELRANCYITKPTHLEEFQQMIKLLNNFWFNIVSLPDSSDDSSLL